MLKTNVTPYISVRKPIFAKMALQNIVQKNKLRDWSAHAKIEQILTSGDPIKIEKAGRLFIDNDQIYQSLQDQIRPTQQEKQLAEFTTSLEKRRFRQKYKRGISHINQALKLISKRQKHASSFEIFLRDEQKKSTREWAKKTIIKRDGEKICLSDIISKAGQRKLAEVYTLTTGLESYAVAAGLTWAFMTLTAPPQMHPNPGKGKNSYSGGTPLDAQQWIKNEYKKAEARCRKQGIIISGLRVAEPHKDGCPHWHVLIFAALSDMEKIEEQFRFCKRWKKDAGLKFKLNNGAARAASYLFKYVLKTISSVEKLEGEMASVDTWRGAWGIRAFQFFGMPPVTLWRQLRAQKECPTEPKLKGIWLAANRGDGHAFIGLAGGLNTKRINRPISVIVNNEGDFKVIKFNIKNKLAMTCYVKKWTKTEAKNEKVEVILNCPRHSQPTQKTTQIEPIIAPIIQLKWTPPPLALHNKRPTQRELIKSLTRYAGDSHCRAFGLPPPPTSGDR